MKEGEYVDERILQLRKYYLSKMESYDITRDKLYIQEKWTEFKMVSMFEERISVLIPEGFAVMPEKIAKVRYISHNRPTVILTSIDYSENYGFHLLEQEAVDLECSIKQMEDAVLLNAPETRVYDKGDISSDTWQGKWFEYKNFTLNDETYNIQFLIYRVPYLLVGTFNCRMCYYDSWKKPVLKALEYTHIMEKGSDSNENR